MGIILFLVDTSASMNQKTYLGTSYLDVAKVAIETFMKYRTRDPTSRGDRYMLVSYDDPPNCVKAGWKENHAAFVVELKNLEATGLSTFGQSLKEAFDLLNIHRLHTSIDHYGQGRNPFFLEPAVIISVTDGGKLTNQNSVEKELALPMDPTNSEGRELTKEPFRWDQRLFSVILKLPGLGDKAPTGNGGLPENNYLVGENSISAMCEITGGKCYVVPNHKSLVQSMESLTQKLHPGVVVNFQKAVGSTTLNGLQEPVPMEIDDDVGTTNGKSSVRTDVGVVRDNATPPPVSDTAWHNTRKMLYVKTNPKTNVPSGFWPIPESFWTDVNGSSLPPREAHPVLWFDPVDKEPMLVENFPFDKYELEPSPLTQYILSRRKAHVCWQVFVNNSSKKSGLVYSFGYLKASSSLTHVTLFVMPFNYPYLLPLIEELTKFRMRPPPKWRQDFAEYIATVPTYYAAPLRNALRLMGAPGNLISDSFDGQMSYSVTNYLRKLKKQAKSESEKVVAAVSKNRALEANKKSNGIVDLGDNISIAIGSTQSEDSLNSQTFKNPFDISRSGLLGQLVRMRTNFLHTSPTTPNLIEEIQRHQLPIGQMGNYQEHLKKINPLRELDSGAVRTQLFGNPFKLERPADSKQKVDEGMDIFADEHMVEMNRRPIIHARRRGRSPSPIPPRFIKPPTPTPPSQPTSEHSPNELVNRDPLGVVSGKTENHVVTNSDTHKQDKVVRETLSKGENAKKNDVIAMSSKPLPFRSSSLPEDQVSNNLSVKTQVDKLQQNSRKRERTPSPTYAAPLPNSKRPALSSNSLVSGTNATLGGGAPKFTSSSLPSGAKQGTKVTPTVQGGSGLKSSASKVLTEEIQKQQGQENSRLKVLIVKEVRKPGKNYDTIFQHLDSVKGPAEMRETFVSDIIKEATKFKKWKLVEQLEGWSTGLKTVSFKTDSTNYKPPLKSKVPQRR